MYIYEQVDFKIGILGVFIKIWSKLFVIVDKIFFNKILCRFDQRLVIL